MNTQEYGAAVEGKSVSVETHAIDPEYTEYLRTAPDKHDLADYAGWQGMKRQWAALSAQYEAEIEPLYQSNTPLGFKERERQTQLLREMDYYETQLGY